MLDANLMTINGAILLAWKFQNQMHMSQKAGMAGVSTKHGHFPRQLDKNARKRKQAVDPGRPPDTKKQLLKTSKKKATKKTIHK